MDLKIFAENVEQSALQQIYALKEHPAFKDQKVRIMPDVHAGAGCVIGFTSTFTDKVVPNIVGVDIGCGVVGVRLDVTDIDFANFDKFLRGRVPSGFSIHSKPQWNPYGPVSERFMDRLGVLAIKLGLSVEKVLSAIGTLGGGNHFIEIDKEEHGGYWLTVHTGSRNFGLQVAKYWQAHAQDQNGKLGGLEYLSGYAVDGYLDSMEIAQQYAGYNRRSIIMALLKYFGKDTTGQYFESVHNYIDLQRKIIRKGAISAEAGDLVIIPFNMRDGLIVAEGKGEEDWNFSAPHGAGRIMGRGAAKRALKMEDFTESMKGI